MEWTVILGAAPFGKFGGAVSLGHPIDASGARVMMTLYEHRSGGKGLAAICSGGDQGDAVLVEA